MSQHFCLRIMWKFIALAGSPLIMTQLQCFFLQTIMIGYLFAVINWCQAESKSPVYYITIYITHYITIYLRYYITLQFFCIGFQCLLPSGSDIVRWMPGQCSANVTSNARFWGIYGKYKNTKENVKIGYTKKEKCSANVTSNGWLWGIYGGATFKS